MKVEHINDEAQELDVSDVCEIDGCLDERTHLLGDPHYNTWALCENHFDEWMSAE